jgi:plastocyanin
MSSVRRYAAALSVALFAALLVPGQASAATTFDVEVGQDFFEQGVPGFSGRFYPGSIKVHSGDTLHFTPGFIGMGPQGAYPQELFGEDNHVGQGTGGTNPFLFDPDDGADALKFDPSFLTPAEGCGAVDDPCVWGSNSEILLPGETETGDVYVRVEAPAGTTIWGASIPSPDANVNFKVDVVAAADAASTQEELDARAATLKAKDFEDAHALHSRMGSKRTWHLNAAGQKVYDVFVGAAAGPIELMASYPRRSAIRRGQRVQFHFMDQMEPHTATFGGAKATEVFNNFIVPACDTDTDTGSLPDVEPTGFDPITELPTCPEGAELEADLHDLLPWVKGDARVTRVSDYENSGLQFPHYPEGGTFDDVNPDPWTVRFPSASSDKGFKFICLVHGGFMGGRVKVTS